VNIPNHRLTAGIHGHVLNDHFLLPAASMSPESFRYSCKRPKKTSRTVHVSIYTLDRLIGGRSPPQALHSKAVKGDTLRTEQCF
jgi:hypothetical protein